MVGINKDMIKKGSFQDGMITGLLHGLVIGALVLKLIQLIIN